MKQLSTRTITIIISLIALTLLALEVFIIQDNTKTPTPVGENREEQENQKRNGENITKTVDTTDWKTYRNEEYGFEVKYPNDSNAWAVSEYDYSDDPSSTSYPSKGVTINYLFPNEEEKGGKARESITFLVAGSRFNDETLQDIDLESPDNYRFQFNGQMAVTNNTEKEAVVAFLEDGVCAGSSIIFSLPDLSTPWTSKQTIIVWCNSEDNVEVLRSILESVKFFTPKI